MKAIKTSVLINAGIHDVFDCLAALDKYSDWLATSDTYQETEIITDLPIRQGTQYRDNGSQVIMKGEITVYQAPQKLTFSQFTELKMLGLANKMHILIEYDLVDNSGKTALTRKQSVELSGIVILVTPFLRSIMKKENERILQTLKSHLDSSHSRIDE